MGSHRAVGDSKRPNTAFVERLNLFLRRACSYLHRRTSGKVRNPERLASAVEILRCAYNFIRPHARLCLGRELRTPAMQAGIFDGLLSWRSVFEWPVRPPKPAVVLARSMAAGERPFWDSDPTVPGPSRGAETTLLLTRLASCCHLPDPLQTAFVRF